ncbi:hypothetical protein V1514DRAFT_329354 [Lipomyces japonicus]|uniref:uncharacterized protein n=1 Tax=Lipomyces japonicus TaxID=56871 RepID=UPI0034CD311D
MADKIPGLSSPVKLPLLNNAEIALLAQKQMSSVDADSFFTLRAPAHKLRKKNKSKNKNVGKDKKKKVKTEKLPLFQISDDDEDEIGLDNKNELKQAVNQDLESSDLEIMGSNGSFNKPRVAKRLTPPPELTSEQLRAASIALMGNDIGHRRLIDDDDEDDDIDDDEENDYGNGDRNKSEDDGISVNGRHSISGGQAKLLSPNKRKKQSEDLFPEFAAQIRAQRAHSEFVSRDLGDDSVNGNGSGGAVSAFHVQVLVESTLMSKVEGSDEMRVMPRQVFLVESTKRMAKVKDAWFKTSKIPIEARKDIEFLHKNSYGRVYDDTTPHSLGVNGANPNCILLAVPAADVESLRREFEKAEEEKDKESDLDEFEFDVNNTNASSKEGQLQDQAFKIFLQDAQGKLNLRVKPQSKISSIEKFYRDRRNISTDMCVVLSLDDEEIESKLTVEDTEIEDEVTIDVRVR